MKITLAFFSYLELKNKNTKISHILNKFLSCSPLTNALCFDVNVYGIHISKFSKLCSRLEICYIGLIVKIVNLATF